MIQRLHNKEFQNLKNYQRIHELDFLTRQIYKQDLIALDIRNIISKYIEYDDTIESNCEDSNQLLLIDDIRKCRGKIFNEWESIPGSMPGRCHKRCCDNCLKCNVYKPIAKSKKQKFKHLLAYQCCKNCYKNNNNKCDRCHLKMDITCKLQKCYFCDKRICISCETFTKYYHNTLHSIHKGGGIYETFDKIKYHSQYCTKCNVFFKRENNQFTKTINVLVHINRKT